MFLAKFSNLKLKRRFLKGWPYLKLALAFGILLVISSLVFYFTYTSKRAAVADFYIEWRGSQVALQGGNPYSEETTQLIQLGSKGHLVGPGEDQLAFVYPLWRVFYSAPVAFLAYDWASAIWLGFLLTFYLGSLFLLARLGGLKFASPLKGFLFYTTLIFMFPAFSSLMLGQSALLAAALITLVYLCLKWEKPGTAGTFLALATVKPQLCLVLIPWLFFRAFWRREWRFFGGFSLTLGILAVASLGLYPAWPDQFIEVALRYPTYKKSLTGPGFFLEGLGTTGPFFAAILWLGLLMAGLFFWAGELGLKKIKPGLGFDLAFCLALFLTLLLPPQTNISNPAILTLPLTLLFALWKKSPLFFWLGGIVLPGSWLLYFLLFDNFYGWLIVAWPLGFGLIFSLAFQRKIRAGITGKARAGEV